MNEITYNDVLLINQLCLFQGEPFGVLDEGRIQSALGNQYQSFYPTPELAFASVYRSLVINHGFRNGNKRTGVIVLYVASKMLNNELRLDDEGLNDLTYRIAGEGGSKISVQEIADQVFSYIHIDEEPRDVDIEKTAKTFIHEHEWLMEELGK